MSEPKLISPMLDNFVMGNAMSEHHGVRCYPAMTKDTSQRYIVKVISIPASQVQLDALLLAGAYSSQASALAYFKELAAGVAQETEILKKLSRFEGFVAYEDVQIVPMDDKVGYDVYMLSPYKRSLERHMRKKPMTHLSAVNLGLDLCASMVVCRRFGYLYVDLKPGNIFINENQEYRVGDLGFVKLDSLKYASLPDKYRSPYTAPEVRDAWSSLNDTIDTYAIGMILYQIYNDGKLPFENQAGSEPLPPPIFADYEMAEIILKAIDPDPKLRWPEPMQMGQALVAYMQRNSINDVPIVPLPIPAEEMAPVSEPAADIPVEPICEAEDENSPVPDDVPVETAEAEQDQLIEEITKILGDDPAEPDADEAETAEPEEDDQTEEDISDLSFMDEMVSDDTAPDEQDSENVEYNELSDEASDILSLADELIALEMPEPVVAPEPIDVPIPAPIVLEEETPAEEPPEELPAETEEAAEAPSESEEDSGEEAATEANEEAPPAATEEAPPAEEPASENEPEIYEDAPRKKKGHGGLIAAIILILLLLAGLAGGYYYYQNYYLQTVDDLQLLGTDNNLNVYLTTDTDNSLLQVVCTDAYGNTKYSDVTDGKASFTELNPDTIYTVRVVIDGFHELRGDISDDYTTPAQTNIVQFDAIAGSEDGSVMLHFTVDGKDSDGWVITYSAEGEYEQSVTFSGHFVTINGLALDKVYTFRLSGGSPLYIVGNDTVTFTSTALIYAQDLNITACNDSGITAVWNAPAGVSVESWTVRCYSDAGYDQTVTTSDLTATFTDIDPTQAYTVEVTAAGMTVSARDYVTANSATITGSTIDTSVPLELTASWTYTGIAPADGWLVLYTRDGSTQQEVIQTTESSVTIYPAMPGDSYQFIIQASDGTTVFDGSFTGSAGEVQMFQSDAYGVDYTDMTFYLVRTPEQEDWDRYDLENDDYTSTFAPGEPASFLIKLDERYNTSYDSITSLFVVRDEAGNVVSTASTSSTWISMWYQYYCELGIPNLPTTPGNYTLELYFNGMATMTVPVNFTISEG